MNQVRGISIKFADSNFKSPFDLEANTGQISIFWTAANFIKFVWNRREKGGIQYKAYYEKEPDGKKGAQESRTPIYPVPRLEAHLRQPAFVQRD